jgi:hypothetical protein
MFKTCIFSGPDACRPQSTSREFALPNALFDFPTFALRTALSIGPYTRRLHPGGRVQVQNRGTPDGVRDPCSLSRTLLPSVSRTLLLSVRGVLSFAQNPTHMRHCVHIDLNHIRVGMAIQGKKSAMRQICASMAARGPLIPLRSPQAGRSLSVGWPFTGSSRKMPDGGPETSID